MTDAAPAKPKFNKELVEQTHYEKRSIWLPAFAAHHFNAGQMIIDGKTFTDCLIEGPAVLAAIGAVFEDCNLGIATNPANLILRGQGERITGCVPFTNTTFNRCRFVGVGFTGSEEFIESFITTLNANKDKQVGLA